MRMLTDQLIIQLTSHALVRRANTMLTTMGSEYAFTKFRYSLLGRVFDLVQLWRLSLIRHGGQRLGFRRTYATFEGQGQLSGPIALETLLLVVYLITNFHHI